MGNGEYEESFSFAARYRGEDGVKIREVEFEPESADGAEGIDYDLFAELGEIPDHEFNFSYGPIGMKITREEIGCREKKAFVSAVWLTEPWVYLHRYLDDQDFSDFVDTFFTN